MKKEGREEGGRERKEGREGDEEGREGERNREEGEVNIVHTQLCADTLTFLLIE